MPSVVVGPSKKNSTSILNRSESLRSEVSDASLQSKKVSFNNDVRIRRIPHGGQIHGQVVAVLDPSPKEANQKPGNRSGCLWINSNLTSEAEGGLLKQDLLAEAETILRNVDKIQCRSSSVEPIPVFNRPLERSKSEILPTKRLVKYSNSETGSQLNLNEEWSPNRFNQHTKVIRIKKPSRRRVGLNSLGETSTSSGSDPNNNRKDFEAHPQFSSDSPLSSISSDNAQDNMSSTSRYKNDASHVSSLATKLGSMRREHNGPLLRSSFIEASSGNTHNNNQPFTYTPISGRNSADKASTGQTRNPREIIYAQVVSSERRDGTPEKRTVHKKFSDLTTSTSSNSPDYQKHIRHFVYDKENWKHLNEGSNGDSSHLLSTYKSRNGSQYGSKNNVTTVLLNSNEDEDSLRSTTIQNNDLFIRNPRSSSSPPRLTERPFFYGDARHPRIKTFDHSSSSSPQFQYSSSSREQSPAGTAAAKLVRNAGMRNTGPGFSTKVASTQGSNSKNHTSYQYMTSKLGYLTPSEYSVEVNSNELPPRSGHRERSVSEDRRQPRYETATTNGWTKTGTNGTLSSEFKRNNNNGYSKSSSHSYATLEKNRKNSQEYEPVKKKTETLAKGTKPPVSSSSGLISTLMRRNKDKKVNKKDPSGPPLPNDGKSKQRNKFLSLFFDKNGSATKKSDKLSSSSRREGSKSKMIVTDSEIDDAERRRDGQYHSWSSVDGSYHRFDKGEPRSKEKLSRGKSYNFSTTDYRKIPEDSWHTNQENDSDYRRDLAKTNYKSATLGRPIMRSSVEPVSDFSSRTKSLDRRNLRTNRYDPPPKIVITPNSPPVDETGYDWEPSYAIPQKSKLDQKWSKSSAELDKYSRHYKNGPHESSPSLPKRSENLRYFGDTDMESVANFRNSRFDSPSSLMGKQDQGFPNQNENQISRRDTLRRKLGRNDGIHSSEESESRFSKSSSRSVFLHAPTVAEIPPPMGLQRRTLSKDEISNYSGSQKQTRHLARSMSVLAPWRPRNYRDKLEVRYDNEGNKDPKYRRPPKPPRSPYQKSVSPQPPKRRSESSENLLQDKTFLKPEGPKASTIGRFGGKHVKRSKSTANDHSVTGGWLSRRKDNQRK